MEALARTLVIVRSPVEVIFPIEVMAVPKSSVEDAVVEKKLVLVAEVLVPVVNVRR